MALKLKNKTAVVTGGETMEDKILRIVRNDMVTNGGTYGIMEAPQMSRQSERSAS